ncbi:caspase-6-like isoform X2, partial [Clarias magur]
EPDAPLEYEMNHKRRGCALIFNQENVRNNKPRHGTNKDRDNLSKSFQALGFEVKPHNDKSKKDVLEVLHKAAQANHMETDCFVCVFLTHGKEGHIYASDDAIKIKEITDLFRGDQCKSLVGKPKIFIFQACAGKKREDAVTGMVAGDNDEEEEEEEAANIYTIPAGADFLMCYSVAEGFRSFRSGKFGSYYIQDFCEMLQKHGSTREFTELLTQVNLKVSQRDMHPKVAAANHADADCFVCVFLTHGETREIYAFDDKIKIKEVTDMFRGDQCKSLVGKPKIFIFQACAGDKYEEAVTGMLAGDSDDEDAVEKAANIYTIPAGADFIMCYSVAEDSKPCRNMN